ncbi:MAG: bifunctional 23S rRNA (guanine(2069)-N(7))-methyltransferase RlmK/23S rRNA (guanine(2445)-N(2))-methyltransferase RlmL, partial [Rhodanobacter sp.]
PPPPGVNYGLLITNPPYGERLGDRAEMPKLYRALGDALRKRFSGWRAAVLAGDVELGRAMQLHADKRYTLYNGALETLLLTFDLKSLDEKPRELKPLSDGAQMLKNRLEKNVKHLRKRLAREGIHCWRAYDQDLPEYAAAIDVYGDTDGNDHLHIQEYRAPADVPADVARLRMREIARVAGEVLDVRRDRITLKTRERGKGGSKYGQLDQR